MASTKGAFERPSILRMLTMIPKERGNFPEKGVMSLNRREVGRTNWSSEMTIDGQTVTIENYREYRIGRLVALFRAQRERNGMEY